MISTKFRIPREFIPYILKKGESFTSNLFIIRYTENNEKFCRFRIIVSLKFEKKAVKRNFHRRRIYEAIRIGLKEIKPNKNLDIILIPKKNLKKVDYRDIEEEVKNIILMQKFNG